MQATARRPVTRIVTTLGALVAGTIGSLMITAEPAAASVPGLTIITQTSVSNAVDKTVTATCPFGTKLINAGGYVTGGGGKVAMDDIFPDAALNFVNVTGLETDAYNVPWSITAVATCASPMIGLQLISVSSVSNAASPKAATAVCPAGKTLLGTGATVLGGSGEVFVDEIVPDGGAGVAATQVTVQAVEGDAYAGNWSVNAFAICAFPRPGQQVVSASTAVNQLAKGTFAPCPAGQVATGGAAEIVNALGQVVMDDSFPSGTTQTTVYGQDNDGAAPPWSITARSLCANV